MALYRNTRVPELNVKKCIGGISEGEVEYGHDHDRCRVFPKKKSTVFVCGPKDVCNKR